MPSQFYIPSLLALAALAAAGAVPASSLQLNRIAATGWGNGAQASDITYSSGVRVYAVDKGKKCVQEWTASGETPVGATPGYTRTACLDSDEFDIDLNSAFSATSLEQYSSLAELRLFYWTKSNPTQIESASWAPGRSDWRKDAQFPKKIGGAPHTSKLTATVAKTSETTSSKSVFYMANGIIKELSQDGPSDSQWKVSPKTFTVKGADRGFNVTTNSQVKAYVDIQAVSYVVNGNVYKKVYLLSKSDNNDTLYEIDWNTDQPTCKPVMTSIASFTAASMYTNDVPGIRLYYTKVGKAAVGELWNAGTITGSEVDWVENGHRMKVSLVDTTFATPLAAAYQYQANNGQGWLSVIYVANSTNTAEPPTMRAVHRVPTGEWTKIDYRLPA